jgi:hypothetical protein
LRGAECGGREGVVLTCGNGAIGIYKRCAWAVSVKPVRKALRDALKGDPWACGHAKSAEAGLFLSVPRGVAGAIRGGRIKGGRKPPSQLALASQPERSTEEGASRIRGLSEGRIRGLPENLSGNLPRFFGGELFQSRTRRGHASGPVA